MSTQDFGFRAFLRRRVRRTKKAFLRNACKIAMAVFVLFSCEYLVAEENWGFFPQQTEVQKTLLKNIKTKAYKPALEMWDSALGGERFKTTYTGQALFNWVLFEAGARTNAMERLFALKAPHHIDASVKNLWRQSLNQFRGRLTMAGGLLTRKWYTFLGADLYRVMREKPIFDISQPSTLKKLSALAAAKSTPKDERPWYQWQLALAAAHQGQNDLANNQISRLLDAKQSVVDSDALYMTRARVAFQQKEFEEAIDWYKKVSKSSDLWLSAKEELAWTYLRAHLPNKTVSELHTVLSPIFASISGPESDFLSAFASLMICDYNNIFKVTKGFKSRHTRKVGSLESLVKNPSSEAFMKFLKTVDTKPIKLASFSPILKDLPRGFQRDAFLVEHMKYRQAMLDEVRVLRNLNGALFSRLADVSLKRAGNAKNKSYDRLKALALNELKEFKVMIQKLHIIEAEVIQRLHLDQNKLGRRDTLKNPVPNSHEIISFPVTQEVWLDEVDNYHAEIRDCPKITRASL